MTRALLAAIAALLILPAASASAAPFTVNSTADGTDANPGNGVCETAPGNGVCTLRAAVQEADATTASDTITLPAGRYTFGIPGTDDTAAAGDLDVVHDLTLNGAGARSTVIDAAGIDRAFQVLSGVHFTLSGVGITGGFIQGEGGGIEADGPLTVADTSFDGNVADPSNTGEGGAIRATSTLAITGSTLANNLAYNGGGIEANGDTTTITDTTITGNRAGNITENGDGGGIDLGFGTVTITNSTIADNIEYAGAGEGGGINGSATLKNTILTGNLAYDASSPTDAPVVDNCNGPETSAGHNIENGTTCGLNGPGDQHADPLIGSLQDNGGPTDTRGLLAGSPAIDHGDNAGCPATDQRGVARPQGAACDVGAYESAPPGATTAAASGVTAGAAVLGATVNPNDLPTTYRFDFGTTPAYGSSTPALAAGNGGSAGGVSATIGGLAPSTTYHYRVVAINADGTSAGADATFTTGPAADNTAPSLTLARLPKKLKRAALLRGLSVKVTTNEPAALSVALKGFARRVTLAKTFNLTLASKSLRLGTGARSLKLKPSRKLLSGSRRFTVEVVIMATDASGNARTVTRTIKVS
jgi:CSLREA domain-containing protein